MGKVRSEFAKSEFYDGLEVDPGTRTIVLETNVVGHDRLRSMIAAAYGSKENPDLEGHVDERIRDLVAAIGRKYLSTTTMLRPADFAKLIQFVALDILTDFAFGAPFGYLERDEDVHEWIKERHESLAATAVRSVTGPWETDEKGLAKSVAAERFGPKRVERQDMLGSFVRNGLTEREARTEAVTQMSACIRGGLRIFPPFSGLLAKVVPPSGDILAGQHIPGGTRIGIAVWAIQRNEVYGENTDIYEPERWLEADEERGAKMSRTLETIFGMGENKCIGRNVTRLGAEKVLFEMLRRFDFTVLDPLNPIKSSNMLFFSQWDMMLRIVMRRDGGIEV
ncbi:cytochrome p450 [Venturia nashicola]|uniref:Cytochrome p450 n=1 Tax=Venturia nashicola TaxID=86259 RepID=A0A4Z1PLD2_9PEZI|nr:cytochrome p450 [Venturia nashicola]